MTTAEGVHRPLRTVRGERRNQIGTSGAIMVAAPFDRSASAARYALDGELSSPGKAVTYSVIGTKAQNRSLTMPAGH
jgi:hypothetical protein